MNYTTLFLAVSFGLLAGCSGGGGDSSPSTPAVGSVELIQHVVVRSFLDGNITSSNAENVARHFSRAVVAMAKEADTFFPSTTVSTGVDLNLEPESVLSEPCSIEGDSQLVIDQPSLQNSYAGRLFGDGDSFTRKYNWCKDDNLFSGRFYINGSQSFNGELGAFTSLYTPVLSMNKGTLHYSHFSVSDRDGVDIQSYRHGDLNVFSSDNVVRLESTGFNYVEDDMLTPVWFKVHNASFEFQKLSNSVHEILSTTGNSFEIELKGANGRYYVQFIDSLVQNKQYGFVPTDGTVSIEGTMGRITINYTGGIAYIEFDSDKDGNYETSTSIQL